MIGFFSPPQFDDFERTQKAKFLHIALLVTAAGCLVLGLLNMAEDTHLDIALFLLGSFSLICVPLNKRGYFTITAFFIAFLMLVIITFSMADGVALKDAGMIAYPIFIIFASFLFNKGAALFTAFLSVISVFLIYQLDRLGFLNPAVYSDDSQLKVIIVLIFAAAFFLWAVMDNWERIMHNLRDTYDLTLAGWGKALEYRDQETEGHSLRVTELTLELARRLGVPRSEMDHIRRGAMLHDIGKMGVPDSILLKTDKLTDEDWGSIKMHPVYARKMLEDIPYLKPALDIPYYHHERWDGSGYPDGLARDDIPFAARIFAVVDVWDALISDRPYRQAWPHENVCAYIRQQSGKMFDPQVVNVFLAYMDSHTHLGEWSVEGA